MAETRSALVEAARALFHEKGFVETTVDEIAERADVAQRTFFRYFPSKQAVLFSDFEALHVKLLDALEARPEDEPPLLSLFIALREHTREVESHFQSLAWVLQMADECKGFGVEGAVLKDRIADNLTRALARRLGVEPLIDPRPAAWAGMMLACFGAAMRAAIHTQNSLHDTFVGLVSETSTEMRDLITRASDRTTVT
jgi:AcrR family transcriptional regulator